MSERPTDHATQDQHEECRAAPQPVPAAARPAPHMNAYASGLGNRLFTSSLARSTARQAGDGSGLLPDGRVTEDVEQQIARSRGSGASVDPGIRTTVSEMVGEPLDGVTVHTDANANRLTRSVDAQAFAVGADVYFAEGRYRPGSHDGDRLIAHELAHVAQQRRGSQSGPLTVSSPGDAEEVAAEQVASASVSGAAPQAPVGVARQVLQRDTPPGTPPTPAAPAPGAPAAGDQPETVDTSWDINFEERYKGPGAGKAASAADRTAGDTLYVDDFKAHPKDPKWSGGDFTGSGFIKGSGGLPLGKFKHPKSAGTASSKVRFGAPPTVDITLNFGANIPDEAVPEDDATEKAAKKKAADKARADLTKAQAEADAAAQKVLNESGPGETSEIQAKMEAAIAPWKDKGYTASVTVREGLAKGKSAETAFSPSAEYSVAAAKAYTVNVVVPKEITVYDEDKMAGGSKSKGDYNDTDEQKKERTETETIDEKETTKLDEVVKTVERAFKMMVENNQTKVNKTTDNFGWSLEADIRGKAGLEIGAEAKVDLPLKIGPIGVAASGTVKPSGHVGLEGGLKGRAEGSTTTEDTLTTEEKAAIVAELKTITARKLATTTRELARKKLIEIKEIAKQEKAGQKKEETSKFEIRTKKKKKEVTVNPPKLEVK